MELGGPDYAKSAPKVGGAVACWMVSCIDSRLVGVGHAFDGLRSVLRTHRNRICARPYCNCSPIAFIAWHVAIGTHPRASQPLRCARSPQVTDADGREITDSRGMGYRYFGAAKNLPGTPPPCHRLHVATFPLVGEIQTGSLAMRGSSAVSCCSAILAQQNAAG